MRKGPTEEADSVRAMKGWVRGLSLTSLHAPGTKDFRPRMDVADSHVVLWSLRAVAAGHVRKMVFYNMQ